jgi:hypothetical protein
VAIATCRRAFSRLSLLLFCLAAWPAFGEGVVLSLQSIRHPAFQADGVTVAFDAGRQGEADIRLARLQVGRLEYRNVELHCADFKLDRGGIDCPRGTIQRAAWRPGQERPALPFAFSYRPADGRLELSVADADAVSFSPLIKRLMAWKPEGRVDLYLVSDRKAAKLVLTLRQLQFASKTGDVAADNLFINLSATATRAAGGWRWRADVDWPQGEAYWAPWYRKAGIKARAEGTLTDDRLDIAKARLDMAGIGGVAASLDWDRVHGQPKRWAFATDPLDLGTAFAEWVQPWLDQSAVPKVKASGRVRFAADWADGGLHDFTADLSDASLTDGTGSIALTGLKAHIPWQRGTATQAEFDVGGGRLGELPLGAFRLPLHLQGTEASLDKLSVPLLDGRLYIDDLRAAETAGDWRGHFSGGVEGVSMPKLTAALKLPVMAGTLTARIPSATYAAKALTLDGAVVVQVFDGTLTAYDLKMVDFLQPTQHLRADVAARDIDLGMLTQTFSFGSIEGRFDADLKDLELQGWKPLRFDARIGSSPGNYRRTISRGALRDISALGGAAGAAAVQASPAGFFNSFDYARIGIGCAMRDDVCNMSGLQPEGDGYLLVEGTGMPRVQVIGYNRRVDWNLLVSRIQAVVAGRAKAVVQ